MTDLSIWEVADGIEFDILVKPKAGQDGVVGVHDGALKVSVTAAPEKGRANKAVVKVLARLLDVPGSRIGIVKGLKSRRKRVRAEGCTRDALLALIKEPPG